MINNIIVSAAKVEELPEILLIKKEAHDFFVKQRPDIYKESEILYTEEFIRGFFGDDGKFVFVAKIDDQIAGYAFIQTVLIELPMMTKRTYLYINDIAVIGEQRNKGVASKLLKHIEEFALEIGATKIELAVHIFSEDAVRLYEKNGYKPRTLRMEKEL